LYESARDRCEADNPREYRPERAITGIGQAAECRSQLPTGHLHPL
jgi:hypothetical protein